MSCSNPNLMRCSIDDFTGLLTYKFLGSAKYSNPDEFGSMADLPSKGSFKFLVPCGKCVCCRIDYAREWANRMLVELQDSAGAVFVTLTYRDSDLFLSPSTGRPSLHVPHLQKFWKRLRKAYPNLHIRYFVAGEYGSRRHRPHYHAIIFGLQLSDFSDLRVVGSNEIGDIYYTSPKFEKLWSHGFVLLGSVTRKSCAYVARYCLKKHYKSDPNFMKLGISPEFTISSRRPGIGLQFVSDYFLSGHTRFTVDGIDGVYSFDFPKSFVKCLKRRGFNLDDLNYFVYNRSIESYERLKSNLLFSDVEFSEYLKRKEYKLQSKLKLLPERI